MAAQPKKPLYDPTAETNQYPKMVYKDGEKAGVIVNSKDEEEAQLAAWSGDDKPAKSKKKDKGE